MSYMPRRQPPPLSRAQQERNRRHREWQRERERISAAALERFKAGDEEGCRALLLEADALIEPDMFNG